MDKPIQWTYAQKQAMDTIIKMIERKTPRVVILHGNITGKTFLIDKLDEKYNTESEKQFISGVLDCRLTLSEYKKYVDNNILLILETNLNPYNAIDDELQWCVQFINMDVSPSFVAKIDDKGRVVIRSDIREDRNIKTGDKVRIIEFEKVMES